MRRGDATGSSVRPLRRADRRVDSARGVAHQPMNSIAGILDLEGHEVPRTLAQRLLAALPGGATAARHSWQVDGVALMQSRLHRAGMPAPLTQSPPDCIALFEGRIDN